MHYTGESWLSGGRCACSGQPRTKNTCQRILKQKQALWNFVDIKDVESTHNLAEQLIRFHVLWRKISFGTQSERGNLWVEQMTTTTATCQLQERNRYDYITAAVSAHLNGEEVPSLLLDAHKFESEDWVA